MKTPCTAIVRWLLGMVLAAVSLAVSSEPYPARAITMVVPLPLSASQFGSMINSEIDRWTPLVKSSGAQVD